MIQFWTQMVFVFFADMLLDVFSVKYSRSVNGDDPKPYWAAFWSIMIALDAGISTIVFVENNWTLISGALGAAVGTIWVVKRAKKETTKKDG